MSRSRYFRFKIWHLLLLVTLVGVFLWAKTQAGMADCEIEVIQFNLMSDSMDPLTDENAELVSLAFRYRQPRHQSDYNVVVFMHPKIPSKRFEPGQILKFRYRAHSTFGFQQQKTIEIALSLLGINREDVEEVITEKNWDEEI